MGSALILIMWCRRSLSYYSAGVGVFLFLYMSFVQAAKPPTAVSDLRYGVALYHYFQADYFSALSELQVAKERAPIKASNADPEVIEGGIQLSFGMNKTASSVFSGLLEEGQALDTKSIAWYYMAKLFYERAEYEAAREHVDRVVAEELTPKLAAAAAALDIQLMFKENRYELANERLAAIEKDKKLNAHFGEWRSYLAYNLAAHYVRQENKPAAEPLLNDISAQSLVRDNALRSEQLIMIDKANTALGFSAFQDENYAEALSHFGLVRQLSAFSDDALLGYGWSAARLQNYDLAISTWNILSQRELAGEAVQESLLAIPYAHLQVGLSNEAIQGYQRAQDTFEQELLNIDEVGNFILEQSLVDLLSLENTNANYNWLEPETNYLVQPHVRSLIELFSYNRFQQLVQTIRDLDQIKGRLSHWQNSLAAYSDLMEYRLTRFRSNQSGFQSVSGSDPFKADAVAALQAEKIQMLTALNQARDQNNIYFMLDEARLDQLSFIESAEKNIAVLENANENVEEEKQWANRFRGALLWSASNDFDERRWSLESDLKVIDDILSSATDASDEVEKLLTEAPDIANAQARIREYSERIDTVLTENQQLMAASEDVLRQQIFLVLAEQRQQLTFYLSEARLAIAQIYDNLYLEQQK